MEARAAYDGPYDLDHMGNIFLWGVFSHLTRGAPPVK